MANKKKGQAEETGAQRQSRKEILRARKHDEQLRTVRIGAVIVAVLLVVVLSFAVVNEFMLAPQREVATVNGQVIALKEWQERVKFERAQRILTLEDQLAMLNNDVGLVQQVGAQSMGALQNPEGLGEAVLNQMAQEKIVEQALVERGIVISEAVIEERVGASFNYFGGLSPTALPEPAQTIAPTPSITPISSGVETPVAEAALPVAAETQSTPFPTPTPVSEESFRQELGDFLKRLSDLGVSEQAYRRQVASVVATERLLDVLAEEQNLPEEDVHASAFLLAFASEKEAQDALGQIESADFLTVWNTIRSAPLAAPADDAPESIPPAASEIIWQTQDAIASGSSAELAQAIFEAPLGEPSAIVELGGAEGDPRYVIAMVSGRETRPLSESELNQRKQQLVLNYIEEKMSGVNIGTFWRTRVPAVPVLDPKFLQPPTPTPALPADAGGGATE